jgi:hypothetical protein
LWELDPVKVSLIISRLLAIFLIAGLVTAPLGAPAAAQPVASGSMDMTSMSDEMPCCPSKAPAPADCDQCVLMAGCMSKCFTGMPATTFSPFLIASHEIALQRNDSRPDGLGHPPPEHPPRTLV